MYCIRKNAGKYIFSFAKMKKCENKRKNRPQKCIFVLESTQKYIFAKKLSKQRTFTKPINQFLKFKNIKNSKTKQKKEAGDK